MDFSQWLESEIRHYPAAGVHYYQHTLGYPSLFSILKSYTEVKYSEWYLNIRLTHEPWGGWKSNFFSPAATLYQRLETNLIPGLLHPAYPTPLWQQSRVTNTLQSTPLLLFLHCSCGGASPPWRKTPGLSWLRLLSPLVILGASWSWWWLPAI